ncbi:MAG: tetratricopeptide repeat protein [Candidatus Eisenbacteria bacterium]|nr:tetratricopeptide repeat protein [Candidatus Eisenbacteria bacterium]
MAKMKRPGPVKEKPRLPAFPRWAFPAVMAASLLIGWGIRNFDLGADPPASISWSQGPFTDGAVVVHNARNAVLFGEWILKDDYCRDVALFPLSNMAVYPVFRAFGVGRRQAAWPNTVFGSLSILLVALALWAAYGKGKALLWAVAASFNYFLIMFQRIPIAEPAMIFLMALSFLFFCLSERGKRYVILSGAFAAAAPLFGKAHAYYFPAVLLATYLLTGGKRDPRRRSARFAAAGMAIVAALWFLLLFLPYGEYITAHVLHESVNKHGGGAVATIRAVLQNAVIMGSYTKMNERMPAAALLGFFGLVGLLSRGRRFLTEEPPATVFLFLWLVTGWFAIALVKLPAPRYLSALAFPILFFAVSALERLWEGRPIVWKHPRSLLGGLLTAGLVLFLFYQPLAAFGTLTLEKLRNSSWGIGVYEFFIQRERYDELALFCLAEALVLLVLAYGLFSLRGMNRPVRFPLNRKRGRIVAGVLGAILLFLNIGNWVYWAETRTHLVRDASRDLGDWLGPNARLMGSYAPTLGLDNTIRVFPYFGGLGDKDVFRKYGVTHVVVVSQGDHGIVKNDYPSIFDAWSMVLSYPLMSKYSDTMGIFRLPSEVDGARVNDYEPSLFERAVDVAKESRWEDALALLQRFREEKPDNADGYYLIGFMYNELGGTEQAEAAIAHAIDLRPERPGYALKLGEIYARMGRVAEARAWMERAYFMNPRDQAVLAALQSLDRAARSTPR